MRDVASGGFLIVVALFYLVGSRSLPAGQDEPGPAFFPMVYAAVLLFLAGSIVFRGFRERTPLEPRPWRPAAVMGLTVGYAVAFTTVGFVATTFIYTAVMALLLGQRGLRAVVIPFVATASLYAAFAMGLGVMLP